MKTLMVALISRHLLIIGLALALVSCSEHRAGVPFHGEIGVAVAPSRIQGNTLANAGPAQSLSGGPNQKGVSVPTVTGIIGRIQNGFGGVVSSTSGNFSRALAQVRTNLPNATDINKVSGFDQVQLLAFAACSDLTTGNPSLMRSRYNVDPAATPSVNQAALVAAGIAILDQQLAGLASQGPVSAQVSTIFSGLVQKQISSTSTVAFMAVCIAASTAGSTMMGL